MNALVWAGVLVQMDSLKMVRRMLEDERDRRERAEAHRNNAIEEMEKLQNQIAAIKEALK